MDNRMNILMEAAAAADDRAVLSRLGSRVEDVGFFDRSWYLEKYPDAATAGIEPLTHFLTVGVLERRDPNRLFHALRADGMADRRSMFCKRIVEAGSDPVRYYRRLQLAYRDFAIVCHSRSGSHLLATALNSHPQLHCQGELLQILLEPHKPYAAVCETATGPVNGAIIMYEHWKLAGALGIIPTKIIHLTREPRQTALSFIRNNEHLSAYGTRHDPHAWRNTYEPFKLRDYPVDEMQLAERTRLVRQSQAAFGSLLPGNCLEITYEELCANQDVETIDQNAADRITGFLGVSRGENLITLLRKTSPSSSVAAGHHKMPGLNKPTGASSAIIEGLANQSSLLNQKFNEVIAGLNNQSRLLNDKPQEIIEGLNNLSRLVNDKLSELVSQMKELVARSDNHSRVLNNNLARLTEALIQQLPASAGTPRIPTGIVSTADQAFGAGARPYAPRANSVLMVTEALARAGAERQLIALAQGLVQRGHSVELLELEGVAPNQPSFHAELADMGVKTRVASDLKLDTDNSLQRTVARKLRPFAPILRQRAPHHIAAIELAIKEGCPTIVQSWSDYSNLIAGSVSVCLDVPRIVLGQRVMPPNFWFDENQSTLYREAYRMLGCNPNLVFVTNSQASKTAHERWMELPNKSVELVYNGFLPSSIRIAKREERAGCRDRLGLPREVRVIGTAMHFAPYKDPDLWLETAAIVAKHYSDVHFVLAGHGHGDIADRLFDKGVQLGLAGRLLMPGARTDAGDLLGAFDVLLLTSRIENTPNIMIEAQAAGIAAIGPDVGGIREAVLDGVTGVVVPERTPQALAKAAMRVLDDSKWRERILVEGPAFVARQFDHDRMVDRMLEVYGSSTSTRLVGSSMNPSL
jgi:glycosyltransferase involved in cell wall biosynthesis